MALVLIIDDSNYNRRLMSKMIAEDYDVIEAGNGREALDIIKVADALPDCILLDLMMPEIGGVEMLQIMQAQNIHVPIVVITADIQHDTYKECIALGAHNVIHKPVRRSELQQAIHEAIQAFS